MTRWTDYYWLGWLIAVFAGFLPVELWALFSGNHVNTLSDTMWRWTDNDLSHPWNIGHYTWPHWLLIIFMVWLTVHLCWGYLR